MNSSQEQSAFYWSYFLIGFHMNMQISTCQMLISSATYQRAISMQILKMMSVWDGKFWIPSALPMKHVALCKLYIHSPDGGSPPVGSQPSLVYQVEARPSHSLLHPGWAKYPTLKNEGWEHDGTGWVGGRVERESNERAVLIEEATTGLGRNSLYLGGEQRRNQRKQSMVLYSFLPSSQDSPCVTVFLKMCTVDGHGHQRLKLGWGL